MLTLSSSSAETTDKQRVEKIDNKFQQLTKKFTCPVIEAAELQKLITSKQIILIDIRTKNEQNISMLPGAITQEEFEKSPDKFQSSELVAYCTIGYRSGKFAEKFKKYRIKNLKGGVLAWSHIQGPFIKDGKLTTKVHTYAKEWNFLNSNYQAISK